MDQTEEFEGEGLKGKAEHNFASIKLDVSMGLPEGNLERVSGFGETAREVPWLGFLQDKIILIQKKIMQMFRGEVIPETLQGEQGGETRKRIEGTFVGKSQ